ncbi:hypothetical protein D9M72_188630 [compost metagenome]
MARRATSLRRQAPLQAVPEREQVLRRGHGLAFEERDVAAFGFQLRERAAAQHGRQGLAELRVVFEHQQRFVGVRAGEGFGVREKAGTLARRDCRAAGRECLCVDGCVSPDIRQPEPLQLRVHRGAALGASLEIDVAALHGHLRCVIAEGAMQ